MNTSLLRSCLAVALIAFGASVSEANAQDYLDQDWLLNPRLSNVYMQTVKGNAIFETHQFNAVEGGINEKGEANVRIELASIDTSNDLRNVRMRFLLFETFKFPHAEISAKLNKAKESLNNSILRPSLIGRDSLSVERTFSPGEPGAVSLRFPWFRRTSAVGG